VGPPDSGDFFLNLHLFALKGSTLNDQLKSLIELQKIDTEIFRLQDTINEFPRKIEETEMLLQETELAFQAIREKFEALEKRKRVKETALEDTGERIRKLKSRTADIKTNKEYQALLGEIENVEKEQWAIEDEILTIMEELEAVSKQKKSEEAKYKTDKARVADLKHKLEDERSVSEKQLAEVKDTRSKMAESVSKENYYLYSTLIEACYGLAVAEAVDEICQGCNMNIPPQLFVEMKRSEEIVTCPQCRRIIYYKAPAEETP